MATLSICKNKLKTRLFFVFCLPIAILNAKFKMKAKYHSARKARRNTNALSVMRDSMFRCDDIINTTGQV